MAILDGLFGRSTQKIVANSSGTASGMIAPAIMEKMMVSHEKFLQISKSPLVNQSSRMRVHLVGSEPVCVPILSPIDFSVNFEYKPSALIALETIVNGRLESSGDLVGSSNKINLLLDHTLEEHAKIEAFNYRLNSIGEWKPCLITRTDVTERLNDTGSTNLNRKGLEDYAKRFGEAYHFDLNWVSDPQRDVLCEFGMLLHWDNLGLIDYATQQSDLVNMHNLGIMGERMALNAMKLLPNLESCLRIAPIEDVHATLSSFFNGIGLSEVELRQINTGNSFLDSGLQLLLVEPEKMQIYQEIMAKILNMHNRTQFLQREALMRVRCNQMISILNEISSKNTTNDDSVAVVQVGRRNIFYMIELLEQAGFKK